LLRVDQSLIEEPETNELGDTVYTSLIKGGTATIVFESGDHDSMVTWLPIFEEVSKVSSVFAYNRPGLGGSKNNFEIKSATDLVERLRRLLEQAGHKPPFILVGHSYGGIFVNVFARRFAGEVNGVFLIDPSHPNQHKLGRNYNRSQVNRKVAGYDGVIKRNLHKEYANLNAFPDVPLTILTAGLFSSLKPHPKWIQFHKNLATLSSQSEHHIISKSGHYIHKDQPGIVVKHLKDLIKRAKKDKL
jgi:pimeloyl-ACP methyl ester carboxylesterase